MGIAQQPGAPVEESVAVALAERHLLIVLDNCEHLVEAVAVLVRLLMTRCLNLRILATSREALPADGERVVPVAPLSVAHGEASPAVTLFVERAQAIYAAFKPAEHLPAIIDVCHRLDGIPLAIELAAARVRSMKPAQIHERLGQRFASLTRGARGAPARHQTLRHAVEWSVDPLSPPERGGGARLRLPFWRAASRRGWRSCRPATATRPTRCAGGKASRSAWSASSAAAVVASQRSNLVGVLVRVGRLIEAATLQGTLDGAMQGAALSVYLDDALTQMRATMAADDLARAVPGRGDDAG